MTSIVLEERGCERRLDSSCKKAEWDKKADSALGGEGHPLTVLDSHQFCIKEQVGLHFKR